GQAASGRRNAGWSTLRRVRDWGGRVERIASEIRDSPTGLAVLATTPVAALRPGPARRLAGAAAAGFALREVLSAIHGTEREVRNAGDAAVIAAMLGPYTTPLGGWAADADFAVLVANAVRARPEVI